MVELLINKILPYLGKVELILFFFIILLYYQVYNCYKHNVGLTDSIIRLANKLTNKLPDVARRANETEAALLKLHREIMTDKG